MNHANIGDSFNARAACGQTLATRYATAAGQGHTATNNPDLVTCPFCHESDAEREGRIRQEMRIGA